MVWQYGKVIHPPTSTMNRYWNQMLSSMLAQELGNIHLAERRSGPCKWHLWNEGVPSLGERVLSGLDAHVESEAGDELQRLLTLSRSGLLHEYTELLNVTKTGTSPVLDSK